MVYLFNGHAAWCKEYRVPKFVAWFMGHVISKRLHIGDWDYWHHTQNGGV